MANNRVGMHKFGLKKCLHAATQILSRTQPIIDWTIHRFSGLLGQCFLPPSATGPPWFRCEGGVKYWRPARRATPEATNLCQRPSGLRGPMTSAGKNLHRFRGEGLVNAWVMGEFGKILAEFMRTGDPLMPLRDSLFANLATL